MLVSYNRELAKSPDKNKSEPKNERVDPMHATGLTVRKKIGGIFFSQTSLSVLLSHRSEVVSLLLLLYY